MRRRPFAGVSARVPVCIAACVSALTAGCATGAASSTREDVPAPVQSAPRADAGPRGASRATAANPAADARWADSVLSTLSLRDKAAQMVWVWTLGDYTAADAPAFTTIERIVRELSLIHI